MTTFLTALALVLLLAIAVPGLRDVLDRAIDELFEDLG